MEGWGGDLPEDYSSRCGESRPANSADRPDARESVTFHEGRPLAPLSDVAEVRARIDAIVRFDPKAQDYYRWIEIGYRNGHLDGWHAGFRAASGIEAATAVETVQQGSTEGESPVPKADAQGGSND